MSVVVKFEFMNDFAQSVKERVEHQHEISGARNSEEETQKEYRNSLELVTELENLFEELLETDIQEFQQFWLIIQALMPGLRAWLPEQKEFDETALDIVTRIRLRLTELRETVEKEAVAHFGVPDDLAQMSRGWQEIADGIGQAKEVLPKITGLENWRGEAADTYRQRAEVQRAAIEEFGELPSALAKAFERIGQLNKASLIAVHDALRTTVQEICSMPQVLPGRFYSRVCNFETAVEKCLTELLPKAFAITTDGREEIEKQVSDARNAPKVIQAKWPSGSDKPRQDSALTQSPGNSGTLEEKIRAERGVEIKLPPGEKNTI